MIDDDLPLPQCVAGEESILGSCLLDPEAIATACEILIPEAFLLVAHREIFSAMRDLHHYGIPTTLHSVSAYLQNQDKLEGIGGQFRLAQLVDKVITTANVGQYALIVWDKYCRRQIIKSSERIHRAAYDEGQNLDQVFDMMYREFCRFFGTPPARPKPPKPIKRKATA